MHNTSLLEILRTFSPEEIKKFEDFVCSPYFNKKSGVINLYKHIKKYAPEFNNPKLEKEKVWNALYKGKEFNYGVFKNLIYDLTHLAEKFIMFEYFQQEEDLEMSFNLLSSLYKKQIKKLFIHRFDTIKKDIDSLYKSKNIGFSEYCKVLSKIYFVKSNFSRMINQHDEMGDDLNQSSIFTISFFLYSFLIDGMNAQFFSKDYINKDENIIISFLEKKESNNLILELIESLKSKSKEMYNILNVYYKEYKAITDRSSVEKYLDFKEALISNATDFPKYDLYNLYSGLSNRSKVLISAEINKSKELLDIIKIKIKDEVILNPDGLLDNVEFINCIQAACIMGDSDFIEDYSDKFIGFLPEDARENMHKFSLAHLFFTRNEFEKSLEQILTINYDLFGMKYLLKNLQMMNYYELNDFNSFLSSLDSYKHFLSKNKSVTEGRQKTQVSFNSFLNKLFTLKQKFDGFELKNLKNEVIMTSFVLKQWLLMKIEELENRSRKV